MHPPPSNESPAFHDDQGTQHASRAFRGRAGSHGVVRSVSRPGTPPNNTAAESFLKTLKRAGGVEGLQNEGGSCTRHLQAHRAVLQHGPYALGARLRFPRGLRAKMHIKKLKIYSNYPFPFQPNRTDSVQLFVLIPQPMTGIMGSKNCTAYCTCIMTCCIRKPEVSSYEQ